MYRLIALDVDGTLLTSQKKLTGKVRQAILDIVESGSQIVIVSGRNLPGVLYLADQMKIDCWLISSGGAYIGNSAQTLSLGRWPLQKDQACAIILVARQAGADIYLETVSGLYWEGSLEYLNWSFNVEYDQIKRVDDLVLQLSSDPLKLVIALESEKLLAVEKELRRLDLNAYLTYSMPYYLEITQSGVNKGNALQRLVGHLGIPLSQVVAIGDGENDLSMFAVAGYSIAMGNAPLKVRQAAGWIAPTNDEDGLAVALQFLQGMNQ